MSRTECYESFTQFKSGISSTGENPRPGRSLTSTKDENIDAVRSVIREKLGWTMRTVSEEVGISIGSFHEILTEKLGMDFAPRLCARSLVSAYWPIFGTAVLPHLRTLQIWLIQTFPFSKLKCTLTGRRFNFFKNSRENSGIAASHHTKRVPRSIRTMEKTKGPMP